MRPVIIHSMLKELVYSTIAGMDGRVFSELSRCPECGGQVKAHDTRRKRFATVIEVGATREIYVNVRCFYCQKCGKFLYAEDSPFYEGTRIGAPIVDFCIANRHLPYHHVGKILEAMRIRIDRGSVRNYALMKIPPRPSLKIYNIELPLSLVSLSELILPEHKS